MTIEDAEAAFADYMKMPKMPDPPRTRALLRNAMMRQRVADDNGVDVSILHDKQRRRKLRAEEHAMLAIERGVGAAGNRVTVAEAFFGDPIPNCERWGSSVALTLSGSVLPLQTHQTFALEARPSLPTAATVSATDRVGPHGLLANQMRPDRPPITTYYDMMRDTLTKQFGERPVDYSFAVHAGVFLERNADAAEGATANEFECDYQNGLRHWPPRALRGSAEADAVAAVVEALADSLHVEQDDRRAAPRAMRTLGSAGVTMYWRKCIAQLDGALPDATAATLGDFRALGLCPHARRHEVLRTIKQRARVVTIIAHATGQTRLGQALQRLCVELSKLGA